MKYNSEFIVPKFEVATEQGIKEYIANNKQRASFMLGEMIGGKVGFEDHPCDPERYSKHFRLEVQAFAQKDWNAFKEGIAAHIKNNFPSGRAEFELVQFGTMFARLESIGMESHEEQSKKAR